MGDYTALLGMALHVQPGHLQQSAILQHPEEAPAMSAPAAAEGQEPHLGQLSHEQVR